MEAEGPEWQEADYAALSIRVDGSKSPLCLVELTALASHLPALSALEKASPKQKVAWTKWLEKAGGATAAPQADSAWQELAVQSQPVQAVKPPPNYSASLVQAKAVAGKAGQPGSHAYHILQITNSCQRLAGRQLLKVRMREDQGGALMVHLYLGAQPAVAEQKAGAEVPPPPTPDPAVVLPLQQGQGGQQGQQQQGQQQQLLQQVQQQRPQQGLAHVKEEQARQEPGDGLVDSILELARQASPHGTPGPAPPSGASREERLRQGVVAGHGALQHVLKEITSLKAQLAAAQQLPPSPQGGGGGAAAGVGSAAAAAEEVAARVAAEAESEALRQELEQVKRAWRHAEALREAAEKEAAEARQKAAALQARLDKVEEAMAGTEVYAELADQARAAAVEEARAAQETAAAAMAALEQLQLHWPQDGGLAAAGEGAWEGDAAAGATPLKTSPSSQQLLLHRDSAGTDGGGETAGGSAGAGWAGQDGVAKLALAGSEADGTKSHYQQHLSQQPQQLPWGSKGRESGAQGSRLAHPSATQVPGDRAHPTQSPKQHAYAKGRDRHQVPKVCSNCGTSNTSYWRKCAGTLVCNACGLYWRNHGFHRPVDTCGSTLGRKHLKDPGHPVNLDAAALKGVMVAPLKASSPAPSQPSPLNPAMGEQRARMGQAPGLVPASQAAGVQGAGPSDAGDALGKVQGHTQAQDQNQPQPSVYSTETFQLERLKKATEAAGLWQNGRDGQPAVKDLEAVCSPVEGLQPPASTTPDWRRPCCDSSGSGAGGQEQVGQMSAFERHFKAFQRLIQFLGVLVDQGRRIPGLPVMDLSVAAGVLDLFLLGSKLSLAQLHDSLLLKGIHMWPASASVVLSQVLKLGPAGGAGSAAAAPPPPPSQQAAAGGSGPAAASGPSGAQVPGASQAAAQALARAHTQVQGQQGPGEGPQLKRPRVETALNGFELSQQYQGDAAGAGVPHVTLPSASQPAHRTPAVAKPDEGQGKDQAHAQGHAQGQPGVPSAHAQQGPVLGGTGAGPATAVAATVPAVEYSQYSQPEASLGGTGTTGAGLASGRGAGGASPGYYENISLSYLGTARRVVQLWEEGLDGKLPLRELEGDHVPMPGSRPPAWRQGRGPSFSTAFHNYRQVMRMLEDIAEEVQRRSFAGEPPCTLAQAAQLLDSYLTQVSGVRLNTMVQKVGGRGTPSWFQMVRNVAKAGKVWQANMMQAAAEAAVARGSGSGAASPEPGANGARPYSHGRSWHGGAAAADPTAAGGDMAGGGEAMDADQEAYENGEQYQQGEGEGEAQEGGFAAAAERAMLSPEAAGGGRGPDQLAWLHQAADWLQDFPAGGGDHAHAHVLHGAGHPRHPGMVGAGAGAGGALLPSAFGRKGSLAKAMIRRAAVAKRHHHMPEYEGGYHEGMGLGPSNGAAGDEGAAAAAAQGRGVEVWEEERGGWVVAEQRALRGAGEAQAPAAVYSVEDLSMTSLGTARRCAQLWEDGLDGRPPLAVLEGGHVPKVGVPPPAWRRGQPTTFISRFSVYRMIMSFMEDVVAAMQQHAPGQPPCSLGMVGQFLDVRLQQLRLKLNTFNRKIGSRGGHVWAAEVEEVARLGLGRLGSQAAAGVAAGGVGGPEVQPAHPAYVAHYQAVDHPQVMEAYAEHGAHGAEVMQASQAYVVHSDGPGQMVLMAMPGAGQPGQADQGQQQWVLVPHGTQGQLQLVPVQEGAAQV